jgi:hypothetical protein
MSPDAARPMAPEASMGPDAARPMAAAGVREHEQVAVDREAGASPAVA